MKDSIKAISEGSLESQSLDDLLKVLITRKLGDRQLRLSTPLREGPCMVPSPKMMKYENAIFKKSLVKSKGKEKSNKIKLPPLQPEQTSKVPSAVNSPVNFMSPLSSPKGNESGSLPPSRLFSRGSEQMSELEKVQEK